MPRHLSLLACRSLLVAAIVGSALPAASAAREPFRLDRIAVTRFSEAEPGKLRRATGTLHLDGRVAWGPVTELARPANLPAFALERVLVQREDWLAYRGLGFGATANFQLGAGSIAIPVGETFYWVAEVNPEARFSDGQVINVSTRFVVPPGASKRVLIRGVGPGLTPFGVTGVLAQPPLTLLSGSSTVAANTNWTTSADAAAITAASAQVGAFGLANNDSALIATLAPGNYTAQVLGVNNATGVALIEVYELP